jgi:hypothetical protein
VNGRSSNALGKLASILIILAIVLAMPIAQAYATLQVVRRPILYARDVNTLTPIQGASIDVNGVFMGTTDSEGGLDIARAYADPQQLAIRKDGYVTYQTTTTIQPGKTYTVYLTPIMVFRIDFENVSKRDANHLNMGIDNWFEFGGYGGATMWLEGLDRNTPGITCHSGGRCVGMEVTDITKSRRNEFEILNPQKLGITNEYFVSVWLYLPADWRMHLPKGQFNWWEIANPSATEGVPWAPYTAIWINQADSTNDNFGLEFGGRDAANKFQSYKKISDYALPRGRWFNLQYYVFRHPTNGIVKVWIDGTLLWNASNIPTMNASVPPHITVAKIYYDTSDTYSPYRLWVDDLQIYSSMPS